jgi:hypothetical protein
MNNSAPRRGDANVIAFSAFRGLRNDVPPERFNGQDTAPDKRDLADLAVATNVDIDKSGKVARRAGYTRVAGGAAHSLWADPSGTLCLVVQGGALCQLRADYTSVVLRALSDATARVSYCAIGSTVYYANGVDTGVVKEGAARSWGLPVPRLPGAVVSSGALPAGRYQFTATFVRVDGQESGAPLAGIIDAPAGSAILFTLPASTDPGVVAKRVYLSSPNGETVYQAFECPNDVVAAAYAGDTNEFAVPLAAAFLGPPPPGQLVAYYRGRMWVAVGDTLYPSEPYAYELFDYRNYLQFDSRITLLAPVEDKESGDGAPTHSGFFVGTDSSCGAVVGSSPEDFSYVPKLDYGAVSGALDYVDGALLGDAAAITARSLPMWLTTDGVCLGRPDMDIQNLTRTRYRFAGAGQGAALFVPGANRFIATANF